ncbi:MAG: leucine-rich repeat domain-containing protein [Candidatus Omnitrophota bacterium]
MGNLFKRNLIIGLALIILNGIIWGAISAQERAALIAFYNANDGDHWHYSGGWKGNQNEPDGFSRIGSEGSWFGISVVGDTVVQISICCETRINQIPPEFVNLSNLESLYLEEDGFTGAIPLPVYGLKKLKTLYLRGNQFESIPSGIANLTNLEILSLDVNKISRIPPELGSLSALQQLHLGANNISGAIPGELGNLTSLTVLDLWKNHLSGNIPPELGNLPQLVSLTLSSNELTGTIPPQLGKYVKNLDLSGNRLSGTIPPEILYSTNGRFYLSLSGNNLSGAIPPAPETGTLPNWILSLSDNNLSGEIPPSFFSHADFDGESNLDLSHNQLSGNLPPEIENLKYLSYLNFSDNNLSGSLPKEIGKLVFIESADFSRNKFSGVIPNELFDCPWLYEINLKSNMFSGEFPAKIVNKTIYALDIGYNALISTNPQVRAKLGTHDPDWAQTQTVLPTNIKATVTSPDSIRVSWTPILYTADPGGYMVYYCTSPTGSWINAGRTADKSASYYDVTGLIPGTTYYFMVRTITDIHPNNKSEVVTGFSNKVSAATPAVSPALSINRTQFYFSGIIGKTNPASQSFVVSNSGGGILNWTATTDQTWLHITPSSGIAGSDVTVSVDVAGLSAGTYHGVVTVTAPGVAHSPQTVQVQLIVKSASEDQPPFGYIETPVSGSTVSGSIPVTGWALDDTGISSVKIFRDPVEGESGDWVYIGDGSFVEGARPDVEAAYPEYPMAYKAGWGYMLLTNFLPGQGNGTIVLHAVAYDLFGNRATLGRSTIICDNAHAVKPFGAIDTPTQGGTASGKEFVNFGWALTPLPNTIPVDGSTMKVWIDGKTVGHPGYNQYREDVAALFPGLNNSNGAGGYCYIDTRGYINGMHTISWSVTDDAGNEDGIGSRYFMVRNSQSGRSAVLSRRLLSVNTFEESNESKNSIQVKKGYSEDTELVELSPDENGNVFVEIRELEPVEIRVMPGIQWKSVLPIGATWEEETGIFYWLPGPGFIGTYIMEFTQPENGELKTRKVILRVIPKF